MFLCSRCWKSSGSRLYNSRIWSEIHGAQVGLCLCSDLSRSGVPTRQKKNTWISYVSFQNNGNRQGTNPTRETRTVFDRRVWIPNLLCTELCSVATVQWLLSHGRLLRLRVVTRHLFVSSPVPTISALRLPYSLLYCWVKLRGVRRAWIECFWRYQYLQFMTMAICSVDNKASVIFSSSSVESYMLEFTL
jgi:hypothetical protein